MRSDKDTNLGGAGKKNFRMARWKGPRTMEEITNIGGSMGWGVMPFRSTKKSGEAGGKIIKKRKTKGPRVINRRSTELEMQGKKNGKGTFRLKKYTRKVGKVGKGGGRKGSHRKKMGIKKSGEERNKLKGSREYLWGVVGVRAGRRRTRMCQKGGVEGISEGHLKKKRQKGGEEKGKQDIGGSPRKGARVINRKVRGETGKKEKKAMTKDVGETGTAREKWKGENETKNNVIGKRGIFPPDTGPGGKK